MTEGTISVLALDACDYRLAEGWGCSNILLEDWQPLAVFGTDRNDGLPHTLDVWPAIARGELVDDAGDEAVTQEWENPALRLAARAAQWLPDRLLTRLGHVLLATGFGLGYSEQEPSDHLFAGPRRAVDGWPGVTDAPRLTAAWNTFGEVEVGRLTDRELRERTVEGLHEATEWLTKHHERGVALAGTHTHILDTAGHVYADDHDTLRDYYHLVDDVLGRLRRRVDRLVVLSDHGMQVEWERDPEPAQHSWCAMVAQQGLDGLPSTALAVRPWLEAQVDDSQPVDAAVTSEQLAALGYVDEAEVADD